MQNIGLIVSNCMMFHVKAGKFRLRNVAGFGLEQNIDPDDSEWRWQGCRAAAIFCVLHRSLPAVKNQPINIWLPCSEVNSRIAGMTMETVLIRADGNCCRRCRSKPGCTNGKM
jgi:hypothetical protein